MTIALAAGGADDGRDAALRRIANVIAKVVVRSSRFPTASDRGLYYDLDGRPIDITEWSRLFGSGARAVVTTVLVGYGDALERLLERDNELTILVSTVWLGVNHRWLDPGPPLIYETMIFGFDDRDGDYCDRYASRAGAIHGHDKAIVVARERAAARFPHLDFIEMTEFGPGPK